MSAPTPSPFKGGLYLRFDNPFETLVACRRALGLTQKEIADKMGISVKAVKQLETALDPHLSTMRRYALAVGVVYNYAVEAALAQFEATEKEESPE